MKRKKRPIGRIENGLFILDEKKHKDFFKGKSDFFKENFQKWLDDAVNDLTKKYPDGYFFVFIKNGKNTIRLAVSLNMERYRLPEGGYFIPSKFII